MGRLEPISGILALPEGERLLALEKTGMVWYAGLLMIDFAIPVGAPELEESSATCRSDESAIGRARDKGCSRDFVTVLQAMIETSSPWWEGVLIPDTKRTPVDGRAVGAHT